MAGENEYKLAKEAFVSNLPGTTFSEVTILVSLFVLALWTHAMVRTALGSTVSAERSQKSFVKCFFEFLLEYVLIIFPLVTSVTYTEHLNLIIVVWFAVGITAGLLRPRVSQESVALELYKTRFRPEHVSWFRSCILIITTISILGVDFVVYPRRFAKTETYGTGFMDVGVGCFVLSNAVVSKRATRVYSSHTSNDGKRQSLFQIFRSVLPLLVLGTARLVGTKSIEYQEHHSEYGIHWNFFYTLATLGVSVGLFDKYFPSGAGVRTTAVVGVAVLLAYQWALSKMGLRDWLLYAPRTNLLAMNKEGICSAIGYLGTYLIGTWLGSIQVPSFPKKPADPLAKWKRTAMELWFVTAVFWAATLSADHFIEPVSRRIANLSYVLWVTSGTAQLLAMFLTARLLVPFSMSDVSGIVKGVSENQLALFLVANLLTGLVNISMKTIYAPALTGYLVLLVYMFVVSGTAYSLNALGLRIKL